MPDWFDADMSPDEFRRLGYRAIDLMTEYYRNVRDTPVCSGQTAQQIEATFDEPLPEAPQDPDRILDAWEERIIPNATHLGSPNYYGYVNGSGSMIGSLAEALAATVNMNSGGWKPAPSATEIERRTIRWIAEAIGYNPDCGGLFTSGGQMANYTAMTAALRNTADYDIVEEGIQSDKRRGRFKAFMADHEGHVSITAALDLMGLGRDAIVRVPSRDDLSMDPEQLERAIEKCLADGDIPFCVVGQAGSINVGVIDPLNDIADICEKFKLWFHADGACGAVGAMLPEKKHLYAGLERADSITLDPHKWLYIAYECGAVLVRDAERLRRSFSMHAPYLRGTIPTEYDGLNYFEYGPQMSRGFRALKVWMTMKHYGLEGYRKLLRQNNQCAERLHELVTASPNFEVIHQPSLFIYSFRFLPSGLDAGDAETRGYVDKLNQNICDELQERREIFIMTSNVRGNTVMRASICSHRTTLVDIERLFHRSEEIGLALHNR